MAIGRWLAFRGSKVMNILRFECNGSAVELRVERDSDGWRVLLPDDSEHRIQARRTSRDVIQIDRCGAAEFPERSFRVAAVTSARGVEVAWNGDVFVFEPEEQRRVSRTPRHSSGAVTAPMPGIVVEVLVAPGDSVETFQPLAVVEAMKVMATLEAPFAGTISGVNAAKGVRVNQGDVLVEVTREADT